MRFRDPEARFGLPPGQSPETLQREQSQERYYLIRWSLIRTDGTVPRDQIFEGAVGTHLTVDSLHSPVPLAVRLGSKSNPFVVIEDGDVLVRPRFVGLAVRHLGHEYPAGGQGDMYRAQGDARFYVSTGPLVIRSPQKRIGLRRGFETVRIQVDARPTVSDVLGKFQSGWGFTKDGQDGAWFYRRGNSLTVTNETGPDVMLWWDTLNNPSSRAVADIFSVGGIAGIRLSVGQSASFEDVESLRCRRTFFRDNAGNHTDYSGLVATAQGAAAKLLVTVSSMPLDASSVDFNLGLPIPELGP